jgi:hypothetical protein
MNIKKIDEQIVESATWLLKYYLKLKYSFRNTEFWGTENFHRWDEKINKLRKIINSYR